MAELKLDELTQALSAAVKAGMDEHEHERKQAEGRGAGEDPLTKEAIDALVDERTNAKLAEVEKAYDEKLARIQAESKRIDPDAAKHGLGDVWPLPVGRLVRKARDEAEKAAQDISDVMHVIGKLATDPVKAAKAFLDSEGFTDTSIHKAIDTYTSTGASEWVPTIFSGQMIADIDEQARVAPLFTRIPMAGKNITMPGGSGLPTVYRTTGAENTNVTEDAAQLSRNLSFAAEDIRGYKGYSDNLDEDSIVSVAPYLVSRFSVAFAQAIDTAILDGDTDGTGIDGVIATGSFKRAWDGLRHKALTNTGGNADLGTFNLDNLMQLPAGMGKYADDPARLAWIVASNTYWSKLFTLKDSSNNPVFIPVVSGNPATNPVVTGQVGFLAGIPIIPSGLVRTDLNAAGQYDGSTTDNTVILLVRRDAWLLGDRRQLSVETDKDIVAGLNKIVMTWRGDFQHLYTTDLTTVMGYNVAVV
jgi:HK97 family phage major capsid protein